MLKAEYNLVYLNCMKLRKARADKIRKTLGDPWADRLLSYEHLLVFPKIHDFVVKIAQYPPLGKGENLIPTSVGETYNLGKLSVPFDDPHILHINLNEKASK